MIRGEGKAKASVCSDSRERERRSSDAVNDLRTERSGSFERNGEEKDRWSPGVHSKIWLKFAQIFANLQIRLEFENHFKTKIIISRFC